MVGFEVTVVQTLMSKSKIRCGVLFLKMQVPILIQYLLEQ